MKVFEIWCEGYAATGEHGYAHKIAEQEGKDFENACEILMEKRKDLGIEKREGSKLYDPPVYTIWGAKLFDNETSARKSFG